MKETLSARLIVWVGVPAALLFAGVVFFASLHGFRRAQEITESRAQDMAHLHASMMDGILQHAQKIPEMMAAELETGKFKAPEELEAWLNWMVAANPEIYGSCIAFRPHGFIEDTPGYAPYVYRSPDGLHFEQLAKPEYNYFQWAWYREPRDAGMPLWSDPYFDEGGGQALMITYSVPFRRDQQFWGIVTIDIAITQLVEQITQIKLGRKGYAFLVDRHGAFQAVPSDLQKPAEPLGETDPLRNAILSVLKEDGPLAGRVRATEPLRKGDAIIGFAPIARGRLVAAFVNPTDEAFAGARRIMAQQLGLGFLGLTLLFGAIVLVARSISKPIQQLAGLAQEVAAGNLETKLETTGSTLEVEHLTRAFNKMTRDLRMQMQELRYTTTVRERLEGELSAARSIQMSLLPKIFPAFPDRPEFDVHAMVRPAREVGGDFYDFFLLDHRRLCVLIGDVAGKGVPAAIFMAVSKALIKATAQSELVLPKVLARVNHELCEEADAGMFVTLLLAVLDTETGELEYCNCGHLSPYLLSGDGTVTTLDQGHAPALALATGLQFPTATHRLSQGDSLFLFTDGVTEALSKSRDFYTARRLQVVLRDVYPLPVQRITRAVVQDVRTFTAEHEQADDISVLALRWLGPVDFSNASTETARGTQTVYRPILSNQTSPNGS